MLWLVIWILGMAALWIWDIYFLNAPALRQIQYAVANTFLISFMVIFFSTLSAWASVMIIHYLESRSRLAFLHTINFLVNLLRSIPQIIGILFGYVFLTLLMQSETVTRPFFLMTAMAFILSIFIFLELHDLLLERIAHFKRLDFYNAMRVCGMSEFRIINQEILLSNSMGHVLNKLIAIFGMAVFLQCSIDFIISVGLAVEVNSVNFPITLGSLLAKIDSKQDILAIGYSLTNWDYAGNLFTRHLQGISVALLTVYSLLCIHKVANAYAQRQRL